MSITRAAARPAATAGAARRGASPAVQQPEVFNLGDRSQYSEGGSLFTFVESDYALEFQIALFQGFKPKPTDPMRVGVWIHFHPLVEGVEKPESKFLSFGTNMEKSWMPSEDGKSIVAIPGGPKAPLMGMTNWALFLDSLTNSGLENGVFTGDISVLDGMHAHCAEIPEPEERKGFQSKTAEVATASARRPNKVVVVTEIIAKPWEGEGGIPEAEAAAAPAARPAAAAAKPITGRTLSRKPAAPAAETDPAQMTDDDLLTLAEQVVSTIMAENPKGLTTSSLKTTAFEAVSKTNGDDVAQFVQENILNDAGTLGTVLGTLGYGVKGITVKPLA